MPVGNLAVGKGERGFALQKKPVSSSAGYKVTIKRLPTRLSSIALETNDEYSYEKSGAL